MSPTLALLLPTTVQPMKTRDELGAEALRRIEQAREKAHVLYEGKQVPHRSCGIALAETFNLPPRPYQSLRKGGITGLGECGAIKAGELVLGEILGDPDPTGKVTEKLRDAALLYRELWQERIDRGPSARPGEPIDIVCNTLTAPFEDFMGPERQGFCTQLAASVAEVVAEVLCRLEVDFEITPIEGLEG